MNVSQLRILTLDAYGVPTYWAGIDNYAKNFTLGKVLWTLGEPQAVLRGSLDKNGVQQVLEIPSIVAMKGHSGKGYSINRNPTREQLAQRDRNVCAYCGNKFHTKDLRKEHIHPHARGGPNTWMNLVIACERCNNRKGCRTPEEAKMPLLYLPYIPSPHEVMILRNRNILADQMDFLMNGVPKKSRMWLD